jgi:hypothetical protein
VTPWALSRRRRPLVSGADMSKEHSGNGLPYPPHRFCLYERRGDGESAPPPLRGEVDARTSAAPTLDNRHGDRQGQGDLTP